jgi:DNA-binding NarL/FixJ family response regulator
MISQGDGGCQLVAEAGTAEETTSLCRRFAPDLLLLDANMPGGGGVALVPKLKQIAPTTRILLYCSKTNERDVLAAFRAGADAFLENTCTRAHFFEAISRLADGGSYLCPKSVDALARSLRGTDGQSAGAGQSAQLTTREKEIVRLIAAGDSSKEIAKKLFLSISTVETHRANLMAKIGARNIARLIQYALREGLVDASAVSAL